ncbi:MAG TPA: type 1 glutamine amidotransferase domain-containing protein [Baekduia sp.]|nr:type 1 glutamine amidotransferase domain-containing protein [Baekduia sp.]
MSQLQGKTIAFLATEGVEQVELTEPRQAVEEAGARTVLVSLQEGGFQGFDHLDKADTFTAERAVKDCSADEFDGVVIPGGVANGDFLRADADAVRFVRDLVAQGKPVASICHGPWILAEADVVRGRRVTSYPSLKTDLRNAGAEWVDEEVVVDSGLVTSRRPDDLPAFCAKAIEEFAEGRHEGQAAAADRDARVQTGVEAAGGR